MPGSWEFARPEVLVAILTRGVVPTKWAVSYRKLEIPGGREPIFLTGMPFDHARNEACKSAVKGGFQWLFFLDDDVMPPPDTIARLIAHGKDVVSGLYFRRAEPIQPVMLRDGKPKPTFILDYQPGQLVEADLVGAGCLLIHRRVLEALQKNWFEWKLGRDDEIPEEERASEDFVFARKAKRAGFGVYVDTSVQCLHAGYGRSDAKGQFIPLEV